MLTFYYAVPPSLGLPLLQKLLQPLQCFTIDSRRTSDLHTPAAFFIEHPCRKLQRPRLYVILAPASSNPFAVFLQILVDPDCPTIPGVPSISNFLGFDTMGF